MVTVSCDLARRRDADLRLLLVTGRRVSRTTRSRTSSACWVCGLSGGRGVTLVRLSLGFPLAFLGFFGFPFRGSSLRFYMGNLSNGSRRFNYAQSITITFVRSLPSMVILRVFRNYRFHVVISNVLRRPCRFIVVPKLNSRVNNSTFRSLSN